MNGSAGDDEEGMGVSRKLNDIRGGDDDGARRPNDKQQRLDELRACHEDAPEVPAAPPDDDEKVVVLNVIRAAAETAAEVEPKASAATSATVIDPKAPLRGARLLVERDHSRGGVRVLHHWRDNFYRWNGSCYEILGEQEVRNLAYAALEASRRATAKTRRAAGKETEPLNPNRRRPVGDWAQPGRARSGRPAPSPA